MHRSQCVPVLHRMVKSSMEGKLRRISSTGLKQLVPFRRLGHTGRTADLIEVGGLVLVIQKVDFGWYRVMSTRTQMLFEIEEHWLEEVKDA